MSCPTCGHEPEGDVQPHHLGCGEGARARTFDEPQLLTDHGVVDAPCAFEGCDEDRRQARGKGPKPKFCNEHSTAKNRKE